MLGVLSQTRARPILPKVSHNWDIAFKKGAVNLTSRYGDITNTEYLTSFRSGTSFEKAINEGARIEPDTFVTSRSLGDKGHNFYHRFEQVRLSELSSFIQNGGDYYRGPVVPRTFVNGQYSENDLTVMSDIILNNYGSKGVNLANPLNVRADLMNSIIELLKDGLPTALFGAIMKPNTLNNLGPELVRSLGSDYLNYVFAVTPLVKDIAKLTDLVLKVDHIVDQLIRDSGRLVRRTRMLKDNVDKSQTLYALNQVPYVATGNNGTLNLSGILPTVDVTMFQKQTTKVWFAGAFTYWWPKLSPILADVDHDEGDFDVEILRQRRRDGLKAYLFGYDRFVADTLWTVTPFSWLVDWFVNVGVVMRNQRLFDQDGLIMPYGYIMAEQQLETTTTWMVRETKPRAFASTDTYKVQQRKAANPFGFGLNDSSLTPWQLSVIGALSSQIGPRR